ncbi:hypothetical protein BaRGS_00002993 [Batillaria attramentaria]|uniref:XK-related protein n=1 Tax=Batillaria attramentaria TaxID=370345 RepID=A0ABD0M3F8_9CAEN
MEQCATATRETQGKQQGSVDNETKDKHDSLTEPQRKIHHSEAVETGDRERSTSDPKDISCSLDREQLEDTSIPFIDAQSQGTDHHSDSPENANYGTQEGSAFNNTESENSDSDTDEAKSAAVSLTLSATECSHACSRNREGHLQRDVTRYDDVTRFDVVMCIVSVTLHIVDLGTDCWLAGMYYMDEQWKHFAPTTALIDLRMIVMCYYALKVYLKHEDVLPLWWFCRVVCLLLPLAPVIMTLEYLYYGYKIRGWRERNQKRMLNTSLHILSLWLCTSFVISAPQSCLQLYFFFHAKPDENAAKSTLRALAVASSWGTLLWSTVMHYRSERLTDDDKQKHKVTASSQVFHFLWRACETGGRVLCIALFASTFGSWVFLVLAFHVVIISVACFLFDEDWDHWAAVDSVMSGYTSVISFAASARPSRFVYVIYYVIFYAENFLMLGLWAGMTSDRDAWFYIPGIVTVVVFFILHIILQLVYYKVFHPNAKNIDFCLTFDHETVLR